jgi:hypothetical protein
VLTIIPPIQLQKLEEYVRSIKEEEERLVLISNYNSEVTFYNKQAKNKSWKKIEINLNYVCRITYCVRQIFDFQAKTYLLNICTYVMLY